jgi:hypothetical protein
MPHRPGMCNAQISLNNSHGGHEKKNNAEYTVLNKHS